MSKMTLDTGFSILDLETSSIQYPVSSIKYPVDPEKSCYPVQLNILG